MQACRQSRCGMAERGLRSRGNFKRDADAAFEILARGRRSARHVAEKPKRKPEQQLRRRDYPVQLPRDAREAFLAHHAEAVYRKLTKNHDDFVRAEELVYDAANLVPGLTPTRKQVAAESEMMQRDKDGVEVDQGIFFAHVLAHPGRRHASLPRDAAAESGSRSTRLREFISRRRDRSRHRARSSGRARPRSSPCRTRASQRRGRRHARRHRDRRRPRHPRSDERDLRAARRRGRSSEISRPQACSRAGINLTHLYRGKIPYLWYITRDMGFVNKMLRGLARPDVSPDEIYGGTNEKPWVAQRRGLRDRRRLPVSAGDGLRRRRRATPT